MTNKARLSSLSSKLNAPTKPAAKKAEGLTANPPHGEKGDFIKLTVTLPPDVYKLIMDEVTRRKMNKEANPAISAVLREAVVKHLGEK